MSLSTALSTAMQQVSTLRQAEIDEQIAAEDLRQAETAFLPRARDSFSITYNSRSPGTPDPSFIAQNAIHEYQNLLGVTGDLNFGLRAAVRRARALMEAARAGTEIARRALIRGVNESYYGAALATAKRRTAEQSLLAAQEFERVTDLNFRAGEVPEVDAIRARLQTAARRDDLAQAKQAEAIANATLGTLLGSGITNAPTIEPLPQTINVQEVEAHLPPTGLPPTGEKHRGDDEDVEAHLPPTGRPPTGEAHRGDDEDVEAHSPPIGLPPIGEPPIG